MLHRGWLMHLPCKRHSQADEEQTAATVGLRWMSHIIVRKGGQDLFEADPRIASLVVAFFSGHAVDDTPLTVPLPNQAAR